MYRKFRTGGLRMSKTFHHFTRFILTPTRHYENIYNPSLDGETIAESLNKLYGYDQEKKVYKGQAGTLSGSLPYLPKHFYSDLSYDAIFLYDQDNSNPASTKFGGETDYVIAYILRDVVPGIPETDVYFMISKSGIACYKEMIFEKHPGRQDIIFQLGHSIKKHLMSNYDYTVVN